MRSSAQGGAAVIRASTNAGGGWGGGGGGGGGGGWRWFFLFFLLRGLSAARTAWRASQKASIPATDRVRREVPDGLQIRRSTTRRFSLARGHSKKSREGKGADRIAVRRAQSIGMPMIGLMEMGKSTRMCAGQAYLKMARRQGTYLDRRDQRNLDMGKPQYGRGGEMPPSRRHKWRRLPQRRFRQELSPGFVEHD